MLTDVDLKSLWAIGGYIERVADGKLVAVSGFFHLDYEEHKNLPKEEIEGYLAHGALKNHIQTLLDEGWLTPESEFRFKLCYSSMKEYLDTQTGTEILNGLDLNL